MLLSIGIIAKNEERYLEGCLKSIKPLLDTGKVELVFVDTGSTDRTVEIASKYTDNIHHFEWINDFAAARNETIKYSKGKWYMYVDADEAFEDDSVMQILDFIESKDSERYACASFHERNFINKSYTKFTEFIPTRIYKLTKDVVFNNKIHECITVEGETKHLSVVLLHYGYADQENNKNKEKRNNKVLLEYYEKNPRDPRVLMYLHNGTLNIEESEKYLLEWLDLVESGNEDNLNELCYVSAARHYYTKEKYIKAIQYVDKLFKLDDSNKKVSALCGHFIKADSLFALNEYEEAFNEYCSYFKKMEDYRKNKLQTSQLGILPGVKDTDYESRKVVAIQCLINLGDIKKALKLMHDVEWELLEVEHFECVNDVLVKFVELDVDSKKVAKFVKHFTDIEKNKSPEMFDVLINKLYWVCNSIEDFEAILSLGDESTIYTIMLEVLKQKNQKEYPYILDAFVNNAPEFLIGLTPVVAECMKFGVAFSKYISLLSIENMEEMVTILFEQFEDYKECVSEYISTIEVSSISELLFECLLTEKLSDDVEFANIYSLLLANYVTNIINEEMLNDDDIKLLDSKYQYGYYIYKYDQSLAENELSSAIRYLGKAVRVNPSMTDLIESLLSKLDIN